jgi:hypothetical protein
MRIDIPLRGLRWPTKTWLIQFTNGYWKVACGKYCPCLERISSNDEVTASFPWNNHVAPAVVGNDRVDDLWRERFMYIALLDAAGTPIARITRPTVPSMSRQDDKRFASFVQFYLLNIGPPSLRVYFHLLALKIVRLICCFIGFLWRSVLIFVSALVYFLPFRC